MVGGSLARARDDGRLAGLAAGVTVAVALGWAAATLPVTTFVLILGGVAAGLVTLLRPQWVFLLLPFAVPFGELRALHLGGLAVGGVELLIAAVAGAWLLRGLARRDVRLPHAPLLLSLLIFVGALLLSLLGATDMPAAVKEVAKWLEIVAVYVLGLAFADEAGARRGRYIAALTVAVVLAGTLEALAGIAQSALRVGPPSYAILGGRLWRAFGQFGQPNPFAGFMNLALMPALSGLVGLALLGSRGVGRWAALVTPLLLAAGAILGLGLALSWSRGAWVGALVGGAVVALGWLALTLARPAPDAAAATRRRAVGALWVIVLVGLLLALAGATDLTPAGVAGRFSSVGEYLGGFDVTNIQVTDDNFAVVERVAHWYAAAGMWADHLWTGVGAGNYAAAYPAYRVPRWTDPLGHAHNFYLNIGAEAGFIGFLAYLGLVVAALAHQVRVAARRTDWARRALALGVLGALVATAAHNVFDNLYVHSMGVYVAILLCLVDAADAGA